MMLKEKKEFFKVCFDTMKVGILVYDTHQRIVLANDPVATLFGYSTEELNGLKIFKLLKNKKIARNFIENPKAKRFQQPLEIRGVTNKLDEVFIEATFGSMEYEGKPFYKILISDIASRKIKERSIVQKSHLLEEELNNQNIELEKIITQLGESIQKESELLQKVGGILNKSLSNHTNSPHPLKTKPSIKTGHLSKEIYDFLSRKKVYSYKKGDTIYCYGNQSNHIFLIRNGLVKTYKTNDLGKELITSYYSDNQYFGFTFFINELPHSENSMAVTDTDLYKISRSEINKLIQADSNILFDFISLLGDKLSQAKEKLVLTAFGSVRQKTASSLIELLKTYPLLTKNVLIISRNDLANYIGIAKETLIRTLHDFKEEKLIKLSPGSITILDSSRLKNLR